jgi:hypothetical protein
MSADRPQFLYGCIYLLFEAYPIVFTRDHHLNAGVSGLMYLPVSIGGVVGVLLVCFIGLNDFLN